MTFSTSIARGVASVHNAQHPARRKRKEATLCLIMVGLLYTRSTISRGKTMHGLWRGIHNKICMRVMGKRKELRNSSYIETCGMVLKCDRLVRRSKEQRQIKMSPSVMNEPGTRLEELYDTNPTLPIIDAIHLMWHHTQMTTTGVPVSPEPQRNSSTFSIGAEPL